MARGTRIGRLTIAQEEQVSAQVWELSLQGKSPRQIAKHLKVSFSIVNQLLNQVHQDVRERRLQTAESDLARFLEGLRLQRLRYSDIYNRTMSRLVEEERQENLENEARALRGLLPVTTVTRALKFYFKGLPTALKALDGMMAIAGLEAKVLGLEQYGKELVRHKVHQKSSELLQLLSTPMEINIVVPLPTPPGWDPDEELVYCVPPIPEGGCPGHRVPRRSSDLDALGEPRETEHLPMAP